MPERLLAPYPRMLARLQAEEQQRQIEVLLFTAGHTYPEAARRMFVRRLEEQATGEPGRRERAPRITPAFARLLGAQLKDGKEVEDR